MAAASNWFRNLLKKLFFLGPREGRPWRHALPLRLETLAERLEPCRSLLWFSVGDLWRAVLDTLVPVWGRPRQAGSRPRTPARRLLGLEVLEDRTAPATLTVTTATDNNPSDPGSLRAAIAQANTDAHNGTSDTIVFASSLAGQTITLSQGELNLSGAGTGTITIDGAGQMTISGNNASTVFAVQTGVQALLQGLTIENGSGSNGFSSGGGIYNNGGTLTVSDSTFANNSAVAGGGIANFGTLTVSDSTFANNVAYYGGGIYNYQGTVTVSDSTLANNYASSLGGGIYNYRGTLTVSDSTLADNSAFGGGGIYNYRGTLTVSDSTLANNSAFSGGGIYTYQGTVTLLSSIVAANTASSVGPDVFGSVSASSSNNLIGDGSGMSGISNGSNGNLVGVTGSNLGLLPLGNYGGPTQTMPLMPGSQAIYAGGPLTTLSADLGTTDPTLSLANAAAITSTPGTFVLQIDSEQILVSYSSGPSFTVLQRGYDGTTVATHLDNAGVFLADDQLGQTRVSNGKTDIGAVSGLVVTIATDPSGSHSGVSLRDALALANSDAANGLSDTIVFAASLDGQTITLSQGELNLSGAGTGTITIDGAGQMTISGNNASTVFAVQSGVQALLQGLTIENGQGSNGYGYSGGGIYNDGGTVTVSDSTLADNSAVSSGGGIYNNGGTLTLSDSTLANNSASYYGGGICNYLGTLTVSDSTLADNSASFSGGGIYTFQGTVTVSDSTLSGNSAFIGSGGGIYNGGGTLTVSDSTLANNSASYDGGGIYNLYGTLTVSDSTLAHNSAGIGGGGIYNSVGTVTVSDSTLADNSASSGGGIYNYRGTLTLLSTIVAANTASSGPDVIGSVTGSNNLIGNGSGMSGISNNNAYHNQVGSSGSVLNPDLLPLGNYGGVTQTMPPAANSPALNTGGPLTTLTSTSIGAAGTTFTVLDAAAISSTPGTFDLQVDGEQILVSYTSGNTFTVLQRGYNGTTEASPSSGDLVFLPFDQRGQSRVANGQTDIGAIDTTLLVTTTSDSAGHSGFSLRDAISQANGDAANGLSDLIVFASNLAGQTITLSQGELNLSGAGTGTITIDGAGQMTISGNNASSVFAVQSGVQALLQGLTIENGQGSNGYGYSGGGIYNEGGTVTVSDSTLADNSASNGGDLGSGGGINNHGGTLTVSDSTFANNVAIAGGGISNDGTLTVSDSTFANNVASYYGGGIYNYQGTVTVSDSTLANNYAYAFSGGGIDNLYGTVTLLSSIVAANTASSAPDVAGSVSGSYNLIGDGSGMSGISNGTIGNQVGSSGSVLNPDLLPLGNYGGPTQTMPPAANSPALNAGGLLTTLTSAIGAAGTTFSVTDAAAISSTPGTFDLEVDGEQILVNYTSGNSFTVVQRGFNGTTQANPSSGDAVFLALDQSGRARVIGGQTDIGAAETLLVTTTSDSVSHTGFSLRDALSQANTDASNGISDLIVFASNLDGQTITLSQGKLNLSGAGTGTITIDGGGQMTISGNNASTVFAVKSGVQAVLEGLSIEGGNGNSSFGLSGGGIYNNGGTLTVSDSTLADNSAAVSGGGIYNYSGTVTVSDSTLAGNSAVDEGGGIYNNGGTVTVSDSTLADNSASFYGGGIYNAGGTVTLLSTIVAANTASSGPDVIGSVSGSDNLIGDGSGMTGISNGSNGNQVGSSGSVLNPDLLPLGNYGGPTQTMPPAANSPALNTGGPLTTLTSTIGAAGTTFTVADAAAITSTPGTFDLQVDGEQILVSYTSGNTFTVLQRGYNGTTEASPSSGDLVFLPFDQRGQSRVANGQTDIGAIDTTLLVTTTSDSAGHSGFSLRDAISQANGDAANGLSDLIVFASSLAGQTITLGHGELNLSGAGTGTITIDGAGQITISGASASSVFAVQSGVHAALEGLTIENGYSSNGYGSGGGIYNNGGTLTVSDSTFANNSAVAGGGIANYGTLTVSDSTFAHNSGFYYGGGIYNQGGRVTVSDSTFANNSGGAFDGGGIYNYQGTVTVSDSTLANNSAFDGGGISNVSGTVTVSDSTLANNSAYSGGGIFNNFGTVTLLSSIVAANTASSVGPDVSGSVSGSSTNNLIGNGSGMSGISNNNAYHNQVGSSGSVLNPDLLPLGNYGGTTQTMPPAANSPALNAGGLLTTLTSTIGAAGTTFTVANAAAISSTPGIFDLEVDGEQIQVSYASGNTFTVLQRGFNGTTQASPSSGDAVFLALDQSGRARVVNGQTDIGPPRLCR